MPARMMTLSAAMRYRKILDTLVPMIPVIVCSPELLFFTWLSSVQADDRPGHPPARAHSLG